MMYSEEQLNGLIYRYPEYVSKEHLRLIAHISKRVARELLIKGFIPCKNNGKQTRQYTIAMTDIIKYLRERETYPEKYDIGPIPSSSRGKIMLKVSPLITMPENFSHMLETFYDKQFKLFPDVITVAQASEITGHTHTSINRWCKDKKFIAFKKGSSYMIPKVSLIEFMVGSEYRTLKYKSQKQRETIFDFYKDYSSLIKL
ncbi:MAG TPA: helix-turn-helix domain-containing protein [Mobilitalea sp.]|nr:helix-turn-helix domain-containing protein [Mobilitalea sp.]